MFAQKFIRYKATNPTTGEEVTKLGVVDENDRIYTLLTEMTGEDIKQRKDELLPKVVPVETEYGTCARFRNREIVEEL